MINQLRMKFLARVEAKSMFRVLLGMLSVLMARFVAQSVLGRLKNLEVVILAGSDATMPVCNGCRSSRTKEAKLPRELIKLPIEITQDKIFNKRGIPIFLCEVCDEQELIGALEAHEKRTDNK